MRNKILLVSLSSLAFLSASCGKLESTKKKTQPIVENNRLTEEEFKTQCDLAGGRMTPTKSHCLTRTITDLPPGRTEKFQIVPAFYIGQYVVASGEGKVDILYDGTPFMSIPGRLPANVGKGAELFFYINASGYKNISAAVWSCFDSTFDRANDPDKKMQRVYCPTDVIPL